MTVVLPGPTRAAPAAAGGGRPDRASSAGRTAALLRGAARRGVSVGRATSRAAGPASGEVRRGRVSPRSPPAAAQARLRGRAPEAPVFCLVLGFHSRPSASRCDTSWLVSLVPVQYSGGVCLSPGTSARGRRGVSKPAVVAASFHGHRVPPPPRARPRRAMEGGGRGGAGQPGREPLGVSGRGPWAVRRGGLSDMKVGRASRCTDPAPWAEGPAWAEGLFVRVVVLDTSLHFNKVTYYL